MGEKAGILPDFFIIEEGRGRLHPAPSSGFWALLILGSGRSRAPATVRLRSCLECFRWPARLWPPCSQQGHFRPLQWDKYLRLSRHRASQSQPRLELVALLMQQQADALASGIDAVVWKTSMKLNRFVAPVARFAALCLACWPREVLQPAACAVEEYSVMLSPAAAVASWALRAHPPTSQLRLMRPLHRLRSRYFSQSCQAQVWWIKNTGFDGPKKGGARIWDSRRRDTFHSNTLPSNFLQGHDTDNFEFCVHNLIHAPGALRKKIVRGRGKYGHHGRTCGFGTTKNGAHKRGRRTLNPGYEALLSPLPLVSCLPIVNRCPHVHSGCGSVGAKVLNMCEDGDEVDYMDLFVRGFPVSPRKKFDRAWS
eukprot:Skav207351  [mRNA]  locus=scaffold426:156966:162794:- [translate_table: standard]